MADAPRDGNHVPVLLGTSNADGTTPITAYVDSATHRQLVDATVSSATVSGTVGIGPGSNTIGTVTIGALQAGSNTIGTVTIGALQAGSNTVGSVTVTGTLPSGSNTLGTVTIGALSAGSNTIGTVTIGALQAGSNTIGSVTVFTIGGTSGAGSDSTNMIPRIFATGTSLAPTASGMYVFQDAAGGWHRLRGDTNGMRLTNGTATIGTVTLGSLPTGSNTIGTVTVNTLPATPTGSNTIGTVTVTSLTPSGVALTANPETIGGLAKTANPTAVADGQAVNALFDKLGKQVSVGALRDLKGIQQTSINNSTGTTTVVTAVAATFLDVYGCLVTNNAAAVNKVTFADSVGGTTPWGILVPATDTRGFMLPVDSAIVQSGSNAIWQAQCSVSGSIEVTMLFVKNT